MTLNKTYNYTILCEDKQMECFVRYFLKAQNIDTRKIYCCPLSAGKQSGEQYVRNKYPEQLQILRAKNYNRRVLVLCIDVDTKEILERYGQLDCACDDANVEKKKQNELVMCFLPKRNIETWIHFFAGEEEIDEVKVFPHMHKNESECKPSAEKMAMIFSSGKGEEVLLKSIKFAFDEYQHVCQLQN